MFAAAQHDLGSPLPGFAHIKRYGDKQRQCPAAKILPGEYYVTVHDELITTVLGSCVSACIRDRRLGGGRHESLHAAALGQRRQLGGNGDDVLSTATRYGNYAMEHMINEILKHGGQKRNLEAKVFGGGRIMKDLSDVGAKNIRFVEEYLKTEDIPILSDDVGDIHPRKVVYFPRTGRALVKRIQHMHNDTLIRRESAYKEELAHQPVQGDIELF